MQAVTLAEVADELYALPPGEFIAARDERARQAKAAGQGEDAAAIRKLARPTTSAWLVNQLSRSASGQLGRLFEVGEALQEAQRTLAGERLRELSAQRRQVVSDLLPVAAGIAGEAGQPASAAVLEELRATLEAALADQDARDAVRTGRLTKALTYAGLGEVDLTAALAQVPPAPRAGAPARGSRRSGGAAAPAPSAAHAARSERSGVGGASRLSQADRAHQVVEADGAAEVDDAAEALAEAEVAAASAADAVASAERDLAALAEQRQFQRRRITHLERELVQAQNEDARLADDERDTRRRRDQSQRDLAAAERRLDQAKQTGQPPRRERNRPTQPRGRGRNEPG